MSELAKQLGQGDDMIMFEKLEFNRRHETIGLESDGRIHFWKTGPLYNWIQYNQTHPLTRRQLKKYELKYIKHYFECLKYEESNTIEESYIKDVYDRYIKQNGNVDAFLKFEARALLNLQDFAEHFKNYKQDKQLLQYERKQAEKELGKKIPGSWLIRNSSFNRQNDKLKSELLKKLGIKFYALSFVDQSHEIKHMLFSHFPGRGWAISGNNVIFEGKTVKPSPNETYFVCFCDMLSYILQKHQLKFSMVKNNYFNK